MEQPKIKRKTHVWGIKLAVMLTNLIQQFNKCQQKFNIFLAFDDKHDCYLIIIPRARMGSESIAHSAFGLMGYWLRGHEGERNNCFSKIQLVGQKYRDKKTLASKTRLSRRCFGFQSRLFSLLVGYNI